MNLRNKHKCQSHSNGVVSCASDMGKEEAALEQILFIIIDEYSQEKQRMLLNGLI